VQARVIRQIRRRNQSEQEGGLALINTTLLPHGIYTLRLTVVNQVDNFLPPCAVTVVIRNESIAYIAFPITKGITKCYTFHTLLLVE
jgi:hypothetical protein